MPGGRSVRASTSIVALDDLVGEAGQVGCLP
jgi:hypothetical protein